MPEIPFRYVFVRQAQVGGRDVCSLLAHPAFCRMVEDDHAPAAILVDKTAELIAAADPYVQFEFTFPQQINAASTVFHVDAPEKSHGWESKFEFPVHYVWWQLDSRYKIAFVPGIGVNAIAVGAGEIEHEVRREIKNALTRSSATTSLSALCDLARFRELEILEYNDVLTVPTPREVQDKSQSKDDKESTLKSIAQKLNPKSVRPAWLIEETVRKLAEKLSSKRPESVLLVGPSGVGKTAAFEQMVRTANECEMGEFEFWQTDGSRLVAGMSGFGQWQERCTELVNELEKKKAVIHFGNLVELIETGKGGSIQQGIADFLRPFLVRGKITAVTECTEEQLSIVSKQSPQMLDAFHQIKLIAPDSRKTGEILLEIASNEMTDGRKTVEPSAIAAINQLHARYATYSAMPGRAVRFFRNICEDTEPGQTIDADRVTLRFAEETGLPLFLLRDSDRLDLTKTHEWFSQRIIGQSEPVDLVVDLMAVVKSNLNRPGRPIASLMFIGPTGVGKTQMAKALAEFMYRDEKKMVRFDMSEYKDPFSASRLIGGFGDGQGLLTGKIRENPFTVLLLDEFEKAHSSVFDLFLQVLGEGRLTDGHGRLVDFSTCVIIMTSNLGVESFREVSLGFGSSENQQANYQEHFIRKVQQHVRPEFFNRIDRVVPFSPLAIDAVERIAMRELDLVKRRYGIANRPIGFKIHKSAPKVLAKIGYDVRYGARPLKRAINRNLVQPLGKQLIRKSFTTPLNISVHAQQTGIHFSVDTIEQSKAQQKQRQSADEVIYLLSKTRRRAQALAISPGVTRMRNQVYRQQQSLDRALRHYQKKLRDEKLYANPELLKRKTMIDDKTLLIERVESMLADVMAFERDVVRKFLNREEIDVAPIQKMTLESNQRIERLILELFLSETEAGKRATLILFSRHPELMRILMDCWKKVADQYDFKTNQFELRRHEPNVEPDPTYMLPYKHADREHPGYSIDVFRKLSEKPPGDLVGYAVEIVGDGAFQIFMPETNVHRFKSEGFRDVLVAATGSHVRHYEPPVDIAKHAKFDFAPTRRVIDTESKLIRDEKAGNYEYEKSDLTSELALIINDCFQTLLNERIDTWN